MINIGKEMDKKKNTGRTFIKTKAKPEEKKKLSPVKRGAIKVLGGTAILAAGAAAGLVYGKKVNSAKDDNSLWDDTAKVYELKFALNRRAYKEIIELIKDELNPHMKVLEIAASTGDVARGISSDCGQLVASDFSPAMIEKAKRRGTPANVIWDVQEATCLTYPDESFDAVIIVNALNVIPNPEEVLAQAKRVLKKDGILIAPNYIRMGGVSERMRKQFRNLVGYRDYTTWTYEGYRDFLTMNGWRLLREDILPGASPVGFFVATAN